MQPAAPLVLEHPRRVAMLAAEIVANRLRARPRLRMILPTGRTPIGMYAVLRGHAADGSLPAAEATLFQLDEYEGLGPGDPRSFRAYLERELSGVRLGAFHGLDGSADPAAECARHQRLLDAAPIDLAVLGLGRDGHVAFDEPGSDPDAGVRPVRLLPATRFDAAHDFGGIAAVPHAGITVGLRTLRSAREILLLVSGAAKAEALRATLEGPAGPLVPASLLRDHPGLTIVCDTAAARLLRPLAGCTSDRAIIVLGHRLPGVSSDDRVSAESFARLRRAAAACRRDPPRVVILTGYTRTPYGMSEAEQMKAEWSVPTVPALLEEAGRNTAENATRSLPLIRAMDGIRRVTVVTSVWHVRTPYFFAPYRTLGLRLSFAPELTGPWLRELLRELRSIRAMRAQRRRALADLRLPSEVALPP